MDRFAYIKVSEDPLDTGESCCDIGVHVDKGLCVADAVHEAEAIMKTP